MPEEVEESAMVNVEFDTFSEEDMSNIAFGVDEEVVEDPEAAEREDAASEEQDQGDAPNPVCLNRKTAGMQH